MFGNNNKQIALFKSHHGNKNDSTFLAVCDTAGKIMRQRKIPFDKSNVASFFTTLPNEQPEKIILFLQDGKLLEERLKKFHEDHPVNI